MPTSKIREIVNFPKIILRKKWKLYQYELPSFVTPTNIKSYFPRNNAGKALAQMKTSITTSH